MDRLIGPAPESTTPCCAQAVVAPARPTTMPKSPARIRKHQRMDPSCGTDFQSVLPLARSRGDLTDSPILPALMNFRIWQPPNLKNCVRQRISWSVAGLRLLREELRGVPGSVFSFHRKYL